ncbi:MAG: hypothetical protein GC165_09615 [Armatimonadetes bacterium]|nr:hypothetical protein [Armatimonadota bacterium]MBS1728613.1 hypothetical protein [Armatimonadota bacterium]
MTYNILLLKDILIVTDHLDMRFAGQSEAPGQYEYSLNYIGKVASRSAVGFARVFGSFAVAVSAGLVHTETGLTARKLIADRVECSDEMKVDLLRTMGIYITALRTLSEFSPNGSSDLITDSEGKANDR